jgi:4-amino-4-deoxy-L-arabinose transferase-like glycosyltransferase
MMPCSVRTARIKNNTVVLLLIVTSIWIVFMSSGIFSLPLFPPDEPKYASAAERMLGTGDFVTPYFNCSPRFDKPPLIYWLIALSFKLFGISAWAARIPSVLSSLGVLSLIYFFSAREFDRWTAAISSVVFACTFHIWVMARAVAPEMLLVFFETAAIFCFYDAFEKNDNRYIRYGYLFAALAFLTKGPVGVIVPGSVVFCYFAYRSGFLFTFRKLLNPTGLAIFFLIGLPWYIAMFKLHGYSYFEEFFLFHNVYRFTGKARQHPFNPLYYIAVITGSLYLWLPFVPDVWRNGKLIVREKRKELFLIIWVLFVLIFFGISANKLHNYVLIAYPPLAILFGQTLRNLSAVQKSGKSMFAVIAGAELLGLIVLLFSMRNIPAVIPAGGVALVFLSLATALRGTSFKKALPLTLAKGVILLVIANLYIATYDRQVQPSYSFLRAESLIEKDPVYFFRKDSEDIVFYSKQCVTAVKSREALEDLLKKHPEFILLIREKDLWEINGFYTEDVVPFDDIAGRKRYLVEIVRSLPRG